jgi:hypothetical protein
LKVGREARAAAKRENERERETCARVWEKIHTPEKEGAIQLVTLDRALGLRFLSLLECQLFFSLAPIELAHHSPSSEPLPDRRCRLAVRAPFCRALFIERCFIER